MHSSRYRVWGGAAALLVAGICAVVSAVAGGRDIPRALAQGSRAGAPAPETILGAIDFLSATHGWIELSSSAGYTPACQSSIHPASSCERATTGIFETWDAGQTWKLRLRFTGGPLAYTGTASLPGAWLHFFDGRHGLVAVPSQSADGGTLYRTANGGISWTSRPLPHMIGPFGNTDITFVDWRDLWLLVHEGAAMGSEQVSVYRTQDAGDHWLRVACTPIPAAGGAGCHARSGIDFGGHKQNIVFADSTDGFLADNNFSGIPYLYITNDGGYHWIVRRPGLPRGVPGLNPKTGEAPYAEYQQAIFLGRLGILPATVNQCRQVKSAHGGTQSRCSYSLYALLSHDGGRSWPITRRIPRPASEQLPPVWQVMDGTTWWSVADGKMWRTLDAGAHWTAVRSTTPAGFDLLAIQFVDGSSGWAIGAREKRLQGVIYATRLLRTLDAGAHWLSVSLPRLR